MFQDVLKELIAKRGESVVVIAKELGVPKTLLYEWRAGIRMPSAQNLRRLSQYFGVSIGALLEESKEEMPSRNAGSSMSMGAGAIRANRSAGRRSSPKPINELSVLFRQASRLSPDDQRALAQAMRENLQGYLNGGDEE